MCRGERKFPRPGEFYGSRSPWRERGFEEAAGASPHLAESPAGDPRRSLTLPTCFARAADGHRPGMTDRIGREEEIEVDVELEEDADNEQVDRAPQPGNTPPPDDPSLDSGAITGGKLAKDH